ncbi:hypothetical protein D3C71_1831310 [compost metagenome]
MEVILRAPGRGVDGQGDRAVRHIRAALHAHKIARLPRQPEKVRCLRFSEQRAFGAVDAVRRHQEIL